VVAVSFLDLSHTSYYIEFATKQAHDLVDTRQ